MITKLVSSYFESDDNSFIFDGYNLFHRLNPLLGTKLKVDQLVKVMDPISGRNLDRVTLRFYDDSHLVNQLNQEMYAEISKLKRELEESYKQNKLQLEEITREKVRNANEKAEAAKARIREIQEKADKKIENVESQISSKTEENIQRLEKEYRNKLKVANDLNDMEIRQLKKEIESLNSKLKIQDLKVEEVNITPEVSSVKRRYRKSNSP